MQERPRRDVFEILVLVSLAAAALLAVTVRVTTARLGADDARKLVEAVATPYPSARIDTLVESRPDGQQPLPRIPARF